MLKKCFDLNGVKGDNGVRQTDRFLLVGEVCG